MDWEDFEHLVRELFEKEFENFIKKCENTDNRTFLQKLLIRNPRKYWSSENSVLATSSVLYFACATRTPQYQGAGPDTPKRSATRPLSVIRR